MPRILTEVEELSGGEGRRVWVNRDGMLERTLEQARKKSHGRSQSRAAGFCEWPGCGNFPGLL